MRFLKLDSTCRVSFYFYNTKKDIDNLVNALNKAYNMFKKYIKQFLIKGIVKMKDDLEEIYNEVPNKVGTAQN